MKLFDKIKENFYSYLYDSSIDIKDRTFVLFSFAEMVALILLSIYGYFFLEAGDGSTIVTILFCAFGFVVIVRLMKAKNLYLARVILANILVFVMRPLMFFAKGGIHNGTPIMFLMGAYYLVLVLDGRFRVAMCIFDTLMVIGLSILSYLRPDLVVEYSPANEYKATIANYIVGLMVLTVLIVFQTRILQREAKNAEEKTKELEELNRAQSRFFSSMSHEIRTPINTVLGLNEIILRQEDASDEIKKDARNIQGAGKMLLALINDILDVSKIEAGKMDIVPVNYSVSALMSEIVNMIWLKAEEKGLKFEVDIDPEVPETLFGDEVRIKQILINLLNNSVKYTREGFVGLHMECEFPEKDYAMLKISVSDSGMGIKAESLPHLFDTFQRVDEEKNRYIEGTGLGLSIVKQLVELMGGRISVSSVYTQGSTFTVELRQGIASDKRVGEINIEGGSRTGDGEKFEHSFRAPNAKVLIVDDNEMNLQVEKKLLDGTELTIDLSLSGEDALKKTLKNRYDVIFMDHLMPEMDGIDCYGQIRKQGGGLNQSTPIIVLTANAGGENIELYNNTGFDGYLVKPVSGKQLEDMLITHLPSEKIILTGSSEMTGSQINTASRYAKKRPVVIAASSMTDIPKSTLEELQISTIPFKVITEEGVFSDTVDIDSDELLRYIGADYRNASSDPPTEEEFIKFFSKELRKAHHLIYITLGSGVSEEYGRAISASGTFENVTVVDSEYLSSGAGIVLMTAARFAQQNLSVDRILSEIEDVKKRIRCSFVIRSTEVMVRRGRISPAINNILTTLWLRPVLVVKDNKMRVGRFLFGNHKRCYENYIKTTLSANVHPDRDFAFITYAGLKEDELVWVEEKVMERVHFEHLIVQKASAGIASNCGTGTFGILFMTEGDRSYNLGQVLPGDKDLNPDYEYTDAGEAEENAEDSGALSVSAEIDGRAASAEDPSKNHDTQSEEKKWYQQIPGIDPAAAIKNSGSEDAFLSVIKIYYDSFDAKSSEIEGLYEAEDWKNYTIKVHALKSSSRLVGALKLGDDAEALENAGKDEDIDYIRAHHSEVMVEYKAIADALDSQFGKGDDLPEIPQDTLDEAYGAISEFTLAKDYECVKMVMDSVKEFKLPPDDDERFKRINVLLSHMDWDEITKVLSERD